MDAECKELLEKFEDTEKKLKDKEDFDDFLKKVNEIESLVKGITSKDEKIAESCMKKAEKYLCKQESSNKNNCQNSDMQNCSDDDDIDGENNQTSKPKKKAINKTIINDKAFKDETKSQQQEQVDQDAFMKMMEEDANRRAEDRKKRKEKADELKVEGERLFNEGKFKESLDVFNEAIQLLKDWSTLYTCRAQVQIQLGNFKEALSDCDWAFRADEKSLNAFVTQSKVHLAMKDYDEAVEILKKAIEVKPNKKILIEGYLEGVKKSQLMDNSLTK